MSRIGWMLVGFVVGIFLLIAGGYLLISIGVVPMAASAPPLPLERTVAHLALHASSKHAASERDPLPLSDANLAAGATVYHDSCATCHGAPGQPRPPIAAGMFPDPPQLFSPDDMVTDDPEGVTYWTVTNGIRLSGMPAFAKSLSDMQRWQVTMLVAHADKLPPVAQTILAGAH
jgi:thiosulfate dehydrogenase